MRLEFWLPRWKTWVTVEKVKMDPRDFNSRVPCANHSTTWLSLTPRGNDVDCNSIYSIVCSSNV